MIWAVGNYRPFVLERIMHIEDIYFSVGHFCNLKKYPLAHYLYPKVEKDLVSMQQQQGFLVIRVRNKKTGKVENAFPQDVLEDYFKLYIK